MTVTDPQRVNHRINLAGDFNGWDPGATHMRTRTANHAVTVALTPGRRYRFRYWSDHGGWFNDEDAGL